MSITAKLNTALLKSISMFGLVCCFILMFALAEAAAGFCVSALSLHCVISSRTVTAMKGDPQASKQTNEQESHILITVFESSP